jgi:pSer/pThr/pTyr-binding forkhead associated (FHA) protein
MAEDPLAWLVYREGTAEELRFPIAGDLVTIGRVPGNDVQVPEVTVSRFHARIRRHGRELHLEDHESTSGTFVDGERIVECRLLGGETIGVGRALLRFRIA